MFLALTFLGLRERKVQNCHLVLWNFIHFAPDIIKNTYEKLIDFFFTK